MLLFTYIPGFVYNSKEPSYTFPALADSIIQGGKIFAYKGRSHLGMEHDGELGIILDIKSELNEETSYKSVERIKNLICLSYTNIPMCRWETVDEEIDQFIESNLASKFYNPEIRFGNQLDWDLPLRIAAYVQLIHKLPPEKQTKFWQALQTYCHAREIAHLPNPQYRYTLYMTLHLASINQLADEPHSVHEKEVKLICPECEEVSALSHSTSHVQEMAKLINDLIDEPYSQTWVSLMKKLYHPVRSQYIHTGKLAGFEDAGGFIALWKNKQALMEYDINLMILNRQLLERYLQVIAEQH
ncbi:hypothetical protein LRY65_05655 [Candidatus Woesebacteria bacterium]|nr:hypothetical protein [Candidatus Woesebacteria bacterium]MCD8506745.1 hypothetical protein [Candidatus Woesebacteria bacterium]MCD8527653.1 hypothetical protein [Candidatus Woesebacteria bacterium]MCD8546377.1 hypothetical protein [Candidatus Woesebacteria bacterium]